MLSILIHIVGVADANAARNSIAKDYMKRAQVSVLKATSLFSLLISLYVQCIWILAPVSLTAQESTQVLIRVTYSF